MLCNKIFENPRKGFLQSLDRGINQIKKRIFFELYTHAFLPSSHGILLPPVPFCFLGHPNVHILSLKSASKYKKYMKIEKSNKKIFFYRYGLKDRPKILLLNVEYQLEKC